MTTIRVRVGGKPRTCEPGDVLASLLGELPRRGVAIARNGEVVPRDQWDSTELQDGDDVEIVRPIRGGSR